MAVDPRALMRAARARSVVGALLTLLASVACADAPRIEEDMGLSRAVERARSAFLASQSFDRLDVTVLVPGKGRHWRGGAVNGQALSYPASCVKLAVLVAAVHWCAEQGRTPDCLDADVRPMIVLSDNLATGRVIDAITGTRNVEPAQSPGYEAWLERRRYVERVLERHRLLGPQRLLHKTYPTNSGEMPSGFEQRAREALGSNLMSPDLAARLMLAIVSGAIEPQAREYMRSLLRRERFSEQTSLGMGLPPGSVLESKIGNAYDTLEDIAWAELPNGRQLIVAAFSNGWDQREALPYDTARLGGLARELLRELGLAQGLPPPILSEPEAASGREASWRIPIASPGRYELKLWYAPHREAGARVVYEIAAPGGAQRTHLDQRQWGARWIKLGDFELASGMLRATARSLGEGALVPGVLALERWPDSRSR